MKLSKVVMGLFAAAWLAAPMAVNAAEQVGQAQISQAQIGQIQATPAQVAVTPPVFLQLEITSACTSDGAEFKIINRGDKWPRTGFLRLYHADDKSLIGERRLRLGMGQKVSFVVKDKISQGRPVAVWVDPEWYKRDFEFDANLNCAGS